MKNYSARVSRARKETEKPAQPVPSKKITSVTEPRDLKSRTPSDGRRNSVAATLLSLNLKSLDSRLKSSSSRRSDTTQSPVLDSLMPSPKRQSIADLEENTHDTVVDASHAFK